MKNRNTLGSLPDLAQEAIVKALNNRERAKLAMASKGTAAMVDRTGYTHGPGPAWTNKYTEVSVRAPTQSRIDNCRGVLQSVYQLIATLRAQILGQSFPTIADLDPLMTSLVAAAGDGEITGMVEVLRTPGAVSFLLRPRLEPGVTYDGFMEFDVHFELGDVWLQCAVLLYKRGLAAQRVERMYLSKVHLGSKYTKYGEVANVVASPQWDPIDLSGTLEPGWFNNPELLIPNALRRLTPVVMRGARWGPRIPPSPLGYALLLQMFMLLRAALPADTVTAGVPWGPWGGPGGSNLSVPTGYSVAEMNKYLRKKPAARAAFGIVVLHA